MKITNYIVTILLSSSVLPAIAGPDNIAPKAKVTVTSAQNGFEGTQLTDGLISMDGLGEWVSTSGITSWGQIDYPSVQLEWNTPQSINRIVFFDRVSRASNTNGGTLLFDDGTQIPVLAIPKDGSAKEICFPAKKSKWVKFIITDGEGLNLGLSEIEVYPSPLSCPDYVSKVDPYIETTRGRYFYFITGARPFGMIGAAPLTKNKNQDGGGYNYNSLEILGFPQVHGWMLSGLTMMPTTGSVDPTKGEAYWKSTFSHEGEIVQPGYQRLFLNDYKIWVEQTASDRVSYYKLRFTEERVANILVNLGGFVGTTTMTDAQVTKVSNTEIEGSFNTTGRFWGGPDHVRIFFVMRLDRPFEQLNGWNDTQKFEDIKTLQGGKTVTPRNGGESYVDAPTAGVSAQYHVKKGDEIQVKFAVSYTNIENARNNMQADPFKWDFEAVRTDAKAEWNNMLGRIDVQGGTADQQVKFYTDLWHVLLGRDKIDDASGDYPDYTQGTRSGNATLQAKLIVRKLPFDEQGKVKFHMYNSDAFWLSQWNLNTLWGMAWPEVQDDFAACLVQYSKNGGLLPRGPNVGGYSYIMTSCPATNLITSAFQKGILTKMSSDEAYVEMVKNHKPGGMIGPKKEIEFYQKHGYYPGNAEITLEAAFQDWSLGQMALKMGKKQDAHYYDKRSHGWKPLYNADQQLIMPKTAAGKWLHNDPLSKEGWVETNAWQATWSLSHDLPQLAQLMGGYEKAATKLNQAFEMAIPDDFVFGYGHGTVSYANQPGCSNAHVFNYLQHPWLSQYWVHQVRERAYGGVTPDKGYGGQDEDQGQMGGVSALMAMGLFSIQGTGSFDPIYEITSPIFDEITIQLNPTYYQGKSFKIKSYNNSSANCYIQKAQLNGKPYNSFQLKQRDFQAGGLLEIWLDAAPNKQWGTLLQAH